VNSSGVGWAWLTHRMGNQTMAEHPELSGAIKAAQRELRTAETGAPREGLIIGRAEAIGRRMVETLGAFRRTRFKQKVKDGRNGAKSFVVAHPTNLQDSHEVTVAVRVQNGPAAPIESAAPPLLHRLTSAFRPGLVTVLSLVAGAYVLLALSNSPTVIGIEAVVPRDADTMASATSLRFSDAVQPNVSVDPTAALVTPVVRFDASVGPAPVPLSSAKVSTPPLLTTIAAPRPATPHFSEVVAAPIIARQALIAPSGPGSVDGPPALPLPVPANLSGPALPIAAAIVPTSIARVPSWAMAPRRLPDLVVDPSLLATDLPSVPFVPMIELSLSGATLLQVAEKAPVSNRMPSLSAQPRLSIVQERALEPITREGGLHVVVAPPAPLENPLLSAENAIPSRDTSFLGVIVRVAVPATVPEADVEDLLSLLEDVGIANGRLHRVNFTVTETHIRYYFDSDAEVAVGLAEMLGAQVRLTFPPRTGPLRTGIFHF
jgi:hypothetical protein